MRTYAGCCPVIRDRVFPLIAGVLWAICSLGIPAKACDPYAKLTIHHGQFGAAVPESEKTTHGAVTVANKNDSDGDGVVDKDDDDVRGTRVPLSAAAAQGATAVTVADVAAFSAGVQVMIEKADESEWEAATITAVNAAAKVLTLASGLGRAYAIGDRVCFSKTNLTAAAAAGSQEITVRVINGFSKGSTILIEKADRSAWEHKIIASISAGTNRIMLAETTDSAFASGDRVYVPEVDLMKLVIGAPTGGSGETVLLKKIKGNIKLWERPTKETEVTLPEGQRAFATNELPKTLWVEAVGATGVRDIVFELHYAGRKDVAKATAIWVQKTSRPPEQGHNPWCTRYDAVGFPNNPSVGADGDLQHLTKAGLVTSINETKKAYDGSRYGHGPHTYSSGVFDDMFGGRILWESAVLPSEAFNPGAQDIGVSFDCTRQRYSVVRELRLPEDGQVMERRFPWFRTAQQEPAYAGEKDEANDDGTSGDEDNTPLQDHIYAYDAPGHVLSNTPVTVCFVVARMTFSEWVRAKVGGSEFSVEDFTAQGSRASDKLEWHTIYYLKHGQFSLLKDEATSASWPVLRNKDGEIITRTDCSVTVNTANAVTEDWTLTYTFAGSTWTVTGSDGSSGTLTLKSPPWLPRRWEGTAKKDGKTRLTLVILEPEFPILYQTGDNFKFMTLKTADPDPDGKKRHSTGTGACPVPVTGGP